jgi:fructosamine-3-kinase
LASRPAATVSGGSIANSVCWPTVDGPLFVKLAPRAQQDMFAAEAASLAELRRARALRVPSVRAVGATDSDAYLALEWLDLRSPTPAAEAELGRQLAGQHRVTAAGFGWQRDNYIGSTPQPNEPAAPWSTFYRDRRLAPQFALAARNGFNGMLQRCGTRLLENLDLVFAGHRPPPALLHGDLWSGNRAMTAAGEPVIFDPAVYYGDREADLAMTRLFGGFGPAFYAAYETAWPSDPGAKRRAPVYDLYHVLNHLNLFGGGYLAQAEAIIVQLETSIR